MGHRLRHRFNAALERYLPEQRLFLRTDDSTRFIRLSPATQFLALGGSALTLGWAIVAAAILAMDNIGAGSLRDQAAREQQIYESRLNALAKERDIRAEEAHAAQARFNVALAEISKMQSALLASEERRRELETGIEVIQTTLRHTMAERDEALEEAEIMKAELDGVTGSIDARIGRVEDMENTLAFMTDALQLTAVERDAVAAEAAQAIDLTDELIYERRLAQDRNDHIFSQLEEALSVSVEPLDKMFSAAGLSAENLIEQVRQGYSGMGGPLTPITLSTKGEEPSAEQMRANAILHGLDRLNLYRITAQKAPFGMPVKSAFRYTSGFGPRWGRMHNGTDFAASYGTPIYATADGVVTHSGWSNGYGRLVKIRHSFGIETRYAHLSKLRVKVGDRVSRGDRIGDMGNSGRSTGTHLHYEVRVGSKPINPMTYIKAARNVF